MEIATQACSSCGYENRPGKKFCGGCGSALAMPCACCGTTNPPNARFCDECGVPLTTGRSPTATPSGATDVAPPPTPALTAEMNPQSGTLSAGPVAAISRGTTAVQSPPTVLPHEELRLVTAVFCDLVGFTPLSEKLAPEEVREIQSDYFSRMSAQIMRYGGTVQKYAGDAVLAFFGAPIAHEDDAERAVLCAIGMQSAIEPLATLTRTRYGVEPAIRVGVNTGEVVSGVWEISGRLDFDVTGDAVNTAARFQTSAQPGEIVVGAETMRLTRRRVQYGEQRDLMLKGKSSTVPGFPVIGLRDQFGERWETSQIGAPLIGRDHEMVTLMNAWQRARGGQGQLVSLVGDAGVGKSRLMSELLERINSGNEVRLVRARCLSYGQEISLWLLADLLRGIFDLGEQDSLSEVQSRLEREVPDILRQSDGDTHEEVIDVVGEVLGLPPGKSMLSNAGAQIRRQALVQDLRMILRSLSEESPTVIVLEDLHWLDESSQDVLSDVLQDLPGMRLLVVVAHRPGWSAPWNAWGWPEQITIRPLQEADTTRLAEAVLAGARLSHDLERYVVERTGGNPFFLEEMLRALQETGDIAEQDGEMLLVQGAEERLPSTLTEILLARLDRLEGEVRAVAQVASVIGRNFAVRLLAQVVGQEQTQLHPSLRALQRAEIAFPSQGIDPEYMFKHVSMREAAYNTLLRKRRRQLHLQAAQAIAELYPSDEYVEIIAYHYARTDEHAAAAQWLERAGDRAASIYANETAIIQYGEARERLQTIGGDGTALARIDEKVGAVLKTLGRYDSALEALERAAVYYTEVRQLEALGRVSSLIGWVHRYQGTADEGIARIRPVIDELARNAPTPALAALQLALANLYFASGKYGECLDAASRATGLARAVGDDKIMAGAEMRRGTALYIIGRLREGYAALEGAIPIAERIGDLDTLSLTLNNLGDAYLRGGELRQSKLYLERSLELAQRVGHLANVGFQLVNLGEVLGYMGEWTESRQSLERGADVLREVGASWWSAYPMVHRGHLQAAAGEWEEARRNLEEAISLAEPIGDLQALGYAHWLLSELELAEGRAESARERLEALVADEGPLAPSLMATLVHAYIAAGDIDHAEETAERAMLLAEERQHRLYAVPALVAQGVVLRERRRFEEAQSALQEAVSMAHEMPYPYAEAQALYQLGILHERRGESHEAGKQFESAYAIFERLDAKPYLERVQRSLAELPR